MTIHTSEPLFDVIAVQIKRPHVRRILDTGKTAANAEAYINMAVARRGVDEEFFKAVPTGSVADGSVPPWERVP